MILDFKITKARVWYLEMTENPKFIPVLENEWSVEILTKPISTEVYRNLYFGVGEKWNWLDRMVMLDELLLEKINAGNTEIYVLTNKNRIAGYVEFVTGDHSTEIQYFGLFPDFIGKGAGKTFLQWSITKAWSYPHTNKVTLNTCSLDHEIAIGIYQNCGFKIIREEIEERKIRINN